MFARTCLTYVAIAAVALISMASAAPTDPAPEVTYVDAIPQELSGPDFLPVPKELFPLCCIHKITECCLL
ncbi:hypothetical protein EMPS_03921 [Entomortierella parvispora]|uniref:Uncharacterized protein n=1 Tax=Entomortierella parvispora TaxID=205924 RepID=A0A9P3H7J3_9FUNG|nr:hypothetical protein EMPS_03921 [Entomortierella parvispora]